MTKLISRNPIQRFKEGRKIIKAYEGFKTKEGSTGNYYYTGRDGKNYVASLYGNKWVYSLDDGNFKVIGDVPKNYETTGGIKFYSDQGRALSREAIARTPRKPWTPEQIKADRAAKKKIPDTTVTVEQAEKNNKANQGKVTVNSNTNNKNSNIKTDKNVQSSADTGITSGKNSINFKTAFNNARNSGLQEFTWRGQKYNTKKAGEENYVWQNGNWVSPNQSALTFKPIDNLSLELPKVTVSDLAGLSGNTSVVQPTKVEPVIQPRNYFNYTLPNYDLIAQNRLKQSGIRTYLKQGGKFKFSNKG